MDNSLKNLGTFTTHTSWLQHLSQRSSSNNRHPRMTRCPHLQNNTLSRESSRWYGLYTAFASIEASGPRYLNLLLTSVHDKTPSLLASDPHTLQALSGCRDKIFDQYHACGTGKYLQAVQGDGHEDYLQLYPRQLSEPHPTALTFNSSTLHSPTNDRPLRLSFLSKAALDDSTLITRSVATSWHAETVHEQTALMIRW